MKDLNLQIQETFQPKSSEIDFLTQKINEESKAKNTQEEAYPFGIFVKLFTNKAVNTDDPDAPIIGGCNGSVVYGSIYTDQLWVDPRYRKRGIGKMLMEKVHELGKKNHCKSATVGTMSFQDSQGFYESLGYQVEFIREGYVNDGKMIFYKKDI